MKKKLLSIFLLTVVSFNYSYNIEKKLNILGLFPHPGISHYKFFQPIVEGLANKGHNVIVVSHFKPKNSIPHYKHLTLNGLQLLNNTVNLNNHRRRNFFTHFFEFFMVDEWGRKSCENALSSNAIDEVLTVGEQNKFDVILMEQWNTDCMMGVAYRLKAPVIALSSCALKPYHYARIGNPANPSYIPALSMGHSEEMSFSQRLANWLSFHSVNLMYKIYTEEFVTNLIRKKFGPDVPPVGELVKNVSLIFVNQHYSLSGAKPLSPAVIELGGIHIQKQRIIHQEIKGILDKAKQGVIYVSWGSIINAKTLPIEKRDSIVKAFSQLKQDVIWKWENDTLPNQPENVHVFKWLPQRDILCHPNVKVFMSHGGLMGSTESAYCGVSTILTPIFGDQFLNSAALVQRGMGTILNYEDITEKNVLSAIYIALSERQINAAKVISYSFKNRPQSPLDTAIWWVEYVAKTKGSPLTKSYSTFMPWYLYYCLDLYLFLISIVLIFIIISILILKYIFCRNKKKKTLKKE